jgi:hypothetical protein
MLSNRNPGTPANGTQGMLCVPTKFYTKPATRRLGTKRLTTTLRMLGCLRTKSYPVGTCSARSMHMFLSFMPEAKEL